MEEKRVLWYDAAQRLRLSQNAKYVANPQSPNPTYGVGGDYTYYKYDGQGRSIETGRLTNYTVNENDLNSLYFPDHIINAPFDSQGQAQTSRLERTVTEYDELSFAPEGFEQPYNNSRGRVVRRYNDHIATYYDYDIHGNVKRLLHQIAKFGAVEIAYDYDLITGNVKQVSYQKGKKEQFFHRYIYDADNRLNKVMSSKNGYTWEEDARYFYYPHGPLARVELGQDKVAGQDYFYTLQGWIKGVNNTSASTDMGKDGHLASNNKNQWFGKDELAYYLGYHKQDYKAIGGSANLGEFAINKHSAFDTAIKGTTTPKGLYNGNISYMLTYLPQLSRVNTAADALQGMVYQYDALHRIKQAKSYNFTLGQAVPNGKFDTEYSYDANGNITKLKRNAGAGSTIDNLEYFYDPFKPNQLRRVKDLAQHNLSNLGDLQNQMHSNNYVYDPIGNLTQDKSEQITQITWNVQNKVEQVLFENSSNKENLRYIYDPSGNRIIKTRIAANGEENSTVYIRDASGNILATYAIVNRPKVNLAQAGQNPIQFPAGASIYAKSLKEMHIYGSNRLGIQKYKQHWINYPEIKHPPFLLSQRLATFGNADSKTSLFRGDKLYEQTNHLGNVLAVIRDKKLGRDSTGDGMADWYTTQVLSAQDYYPFGLEMYGRKFNTGEYKFGFNGQEKNQEITNENYDFGARIYDSRIGRWWTIDPKKELYPNISPYAFSLNNPIKFIDPSGGVVEDPEGNIIFTPTGNPCIDVE